MNELRGVEASKALGDVSLRRITGVANLIAKKNVPRSWRTISRLPDLDAQFTPNDPNAPNA
jgi:hypothetical protein